MSKHASKSAERERTAAPVLPTQFLRQHGYDVEGPRVGGHDPGAVGILLGTGRGQEAGIVVEAGRPRDGADGATVTVWVVAGESQGAFQVVHGHGSIVRKAA